MTDNDFLDALFSLGSDDTTAKKRTTYAKSPIPWVGGKKFSLDYIIPEVEKRLHDKWVEVFGGSGVVSWNVPDTEIMIYNDRYSGVVDFYRTLQNPEMIDKLLDRLDNYTHPHSREEWIRARAGWEDTEDPIARAAQWFYMIKNSVIGKGHSFGRSTHTRPPISIPSSLDIFKPIHYKLKKFTLENLDWRVCLDDFDAQYGVFYLDPPYVSTTAGVYVQGFSQSDLVQMLHKISTMKGTVLLSHYENETIDACDFWDEKISWQVRMGADVLAYTESNHKEQRNKGDIAARECLWIKESV